jgi:hypothetical protein
MDVQILRWWAKFQKLGYLDKRRIFSQIVSEETGISCEWKIYRILTRLTFKRYKDLHKIPYPDDKFVQKLLDELCLSPSTVNNWYYDTIDKVAFEQKCEKCESCRFTHTCNGSLDKKSYTNIVKKYEFKLMSNRLYQILIKVDKFKGLLCEEIEDPELMLILRRLMQYEYYTKKEVVHSQRELAVLEALNKMSAKSGTVLRWFYVLKHSKELVEMAKANQISPNEVVKRCMKSMKHDLRDICFDEGGEFA